MSYENDQDDYDEDDNTNWPQHVSVAGLTVILVVLFFLGFCRPKKAHAQIIRVQKQDESLFTVQRVASTISLGVLQMPELADPNANDQWRFGITPQIRATAELVFHDEYSVGVAATFAQVPIVHVPGYYYGRSYPYTPGGQCYYCFGDPHGNYMQILGLLRSGQANRVGGLYWVNEGWAGLALTNLYAKSVGQDYQSSQNGYGGVDANLTFGLTEGPGFSFGNGFALEITYDEGATIYSQPALIISNDQWHWHWATHVGIRWNVRRYGDP